MIKVVPFLYRETKEKPEDQPGLKPQSCLLLQETPQRGGNKPKSSKKTNIHVMVEFGLQVGKPSKVFFAFSIAPARIAALS